MRIRKCNVCDQVLTKEDDYFTLDEIAFNRGSKDPKSVRIYFSDTKKEETYKMDESWVSYTDLDFCVPCFEKENLKKYLI